VERDTVKFLWLGLLGLVVLSFFALLVESLPMEREIRDNVREVLGEAGYHQMGVEVRGRDVTLTGRVSGRVASGAAIRLAAEVPGVRTVLDGTRIAPESLSWLKLRLKRDGVWYARGVLPDADSWLQLEEVLRSRHPGSGTRAELVDRVVDPERADPDWLDAVEGVLDLVSGLDGAALELSAGTLDVSGSLADPALYPGTVRALETLAADERLDLINRISLRPSG